MLKHLLNWPRFAKQLFVVSLDICMGVLAMWLAFSLRLDTLHFPESGNQWMVYALGPILAFPIFMKIGLYRAIFRYNGIAALIATGRAVAFYGITLLAILVTAQWEGVPRSAGILQPLILLLLVGTSRALGWWWLSGFKRNVQHRLVIYGAGSAGAQTAAGLSGMRNHVLVGFVDDDPDKEGTSINGTDVHAASDLARLVKRAGVTDVLLAIPSATPQRRREIIAHVSNLQVRVRTLPGLTDLASGRVSVTDFQDIDIGDLLDRDPVPPDPELLERHIHNQTVMVTGAGGSIGTELCRQILAAHPCVLVLVEHSEYALYRIHDELTRHPLVLSGRCKILPVIANVTNEQRMSALCQAHRPDCIFHAAAYKHVPLVEENAAEGVFNNVFGTLATVRAALSAEVPCFVLISTDKAVRPTNVMGASKRVAEMILQALSAAGQKAPQVQETASPSMRLAIVRFGNVLGSSGSVIPLFRRQIAAGGPVTVTHAEVTRYFMTIPEAAELVLQAGAMSKGGEVFLLDMGQPVRIMELARRMIALSGLTLRDDSHPQGDVQIVVTGLRPGEKLCEELLIGENPAPTLHPRIMQAHEDFLPWPELQTALAALAAAVQQDDDPQIREILSRLVTGARLASPGDRASAKAFHSIDTRMSSPT